MNSRKRSKYAHYDLRVVVALNLLMMAVLLALPSLGVDDKSWTVLLLCVVWFLFSFLAPGFLQLWKDRKLNRCELCAAKRAKSANDDMVWARRFGLDVCGDCGFKLRVAFGNVEAPETRVDAVVH